MKSNTTEEKFYRWYQILFLSKYALSSKKKWTFILEDISAHKKFLFFIYTTVTVTKHLKRFMLINSSFSTTKLKKKSKAKLYVLNNHLVKLKNSSGELYPIKICNILQFWWISCTNFNFQVAERFIFPVHSLRQDWGHFYVFVCDQLNALIQLLTNSI